MDYRYGSHTVYKIEYHLVWVTKYRYWGRHFWARGYFCVTVGDMTEEMIQECLDHLFEPDPARDFRVEP
ncbi:MAG: transposase [Nitrospira sp.]|nr:transposase [Nitrospira sp.]